MRTENREHLNEGDFTEEWSNYFSSLLPLTTTRTVIPVWHQCSPDPSPADPTAFGPEFPEYPQSSVWSKSQQWNAIFPRGHVVITPTAYHNMLQGPGLSRGDVTGIRDGFSCFLQQQLHYLQALYWTGRWEVLWFLFLFTQKQWQNASHQATAGPSSPPLCWGLNLCKRDTKRRCRKALRQSDTCNGHTSSALTRSTLH